MVEDRVRAFVSGCRGLVSSLPAVLAAVEERRAVVPRSEWPAGVDRAVGAYVLREVDAAVRTVRLSLVRLELNSGAMWSAERHRLVQAAARRVGEARRGVAEVLAALGVAHDEVAAGVGRLERAERVQKLEAAVGRFAGESTVVGEALRGTEVGRVLLAVRDCLHALEEFVLAARDLVGEESAGEGAWSLFMAAALAMEAATELEAAEQAREQAGFDGTVGDLRVALGELASFSSTGEVVLPPGWESAALSAAASALSAAESVLMGKDGVLMVAPGRWEPTGKQVAQAKLGEAAGVVSLTDIAGGPEQVDEARNEVPPILVAMRAVAAAGETGLALRYGASLRGALPTRAWDEVTTLAAAVVSIGSAIRLVSKRLGRARSVPPIGEWLGAAADAAGVGAEWLLREDSA